MLEYYAQPVKVDLFPVDAQGKRSTRIEHTPDFLLIRRSGLILEEWRQEERLIRYSTKDPWKYNKEGEIWRFPLMEAHLSEMGIEYRLRSSREHPHLIERHKMMQQWADYLDGLKCLGVGLGEVS